MPDFGEEFDAKLEGKGPSAVEPLTPTRALLVIELQITYPYQIGQALTAINPPKIPHFAGNVRITMDAFGEGMDNPATAIVNYLDGEGESM